MSERRAVAETLQYGGTGAEHAVPLPSRTIVYGASEVIPEGALDGTLISARSGTIAQLGGHPARRGMSLAGGPSGRVDGPGPARQRYEAREVLGQGGAGVVLRARDHHIERTVAVKRLRPDLGDEGALSRFLDEMRIVGQLEHPNIVPIHDVGVDERGEHFFVMKLVEGETLEAIIDRLAAGDPETHRRYPHHRRLDLFLGILEAVHHAHQRGYLHRDLKPANVMVSHTGEVLVTDWGIACSLEEAARSGVLAGTPRYMSPEQARRDGLDVRSDVYSLGVLLHELLTLRHYLADVETVSEALEEVQRRQASPFGWVKSRHQAPAPMELFWFVRPALEKDPARRYPDVGEMIRRIKRSNAGFVPIQCHVTFSKRLSSELTRWIDRHPMVFTGALATGVLGGLGAVVLALLR
jgi:serine/threonine-protein kinase